MIATVSYSLVFAVVTYATTSSANVRTGAVLLMLALPAIMASEMGDAKVLVDSWSKEFVGTAVMIICTCSPGPAVGHLGYRAEWTLHWAMMALADYSCGGPQVNPAVTVALYAAGGFGFTPTLVLTNVCAQVAGGILGWLFLYETSGLFPSAVGGPLPDSRLPSGYLLSAEALACFILLAGVFAFATTKPFQSPDPKIYSAKMTLINATVRSIIVFIGVTGPAINPALATSFAFVFDSDALLPSETNHYLAYWLGGLLGALMMATVWKLLTKQQLSDSLKIPIAVSLAFAAFFLWTASYQPSADAFLDDLARDQWNDALKQRHPLSKLFKRLPKDAVPPPGVTGANKAS